MLIPRFRRRRRGSLVATLLVTVCLTAATWRSNLDTGRIEGAVGKGQAAAVRHGTVESVGTRHMDTLGGKVDAGVVQPGLDKSQSFYARAAAQLHQGVPVFTFQQPNKPLPGRNTVRRQGTGIAERGVAVVVGGQVGVGIGHALHSPSVDREGG